MHAWALVGLLCHRYPLFRVVFQLIACSDYFYFIAHVTFVSNNVDDYYVDNHRNFHTLSMTSEHVSTALLWYHKQVMRATVQTALRVTACGRVWAFAVARSTTDHNQQHCLTTTHCDMPGLTVDYYNLQSVSYTRCGKM